MGELKQETTDVTTPPWLLWPDRRHVGARLRRLHTSRGARRGGLGRIGVARNAQGPPQAGLRRLRHHEGFPLGFANNFLTPNESATAVLIFRHRGLSYALSHAMWEKYKIGETFKIIDPETKAHAVKNPWFEPKPGVLQNADAALDRLIARGTVIGACAVAMRGQARRLAPNAGVTPEEALKEFTANVLPSVTIIPSGTWGVNRAQEAGCTYCAGG